MNSEYYSNLILVLILVLIVFIEKDKFKREGIMFLRRTKRGLKFINNIAKKYRKQIQVLMDYSVILSFGMIGIYYFFKRKNYSKIRLGILSLLYLISSYILFLHTDSLFRGVFNVFNISETATQNMIYFLKTFSVLTGISGYVFITIFISSIITVISTILSNITESPVKLVLPVSLPESWNAPVLSVPLIPWFISIFVLVIVHEFSHAITARSEGIKVKSLGYGFLAILPLGFAEPDEEQLKKSDPVKKLRVFTAGSFANFITAILFTLLLLLLSYPLNSMDSMFYNYDGLQYTGLVNGTHAVDILPRQGIIKKVDGVEIHNYTDFKSVLDQKHPGQEVLLEILSNNTTKEYSVNLSERDNRSFIGIYNVKIHKSLKSGAEKTIIYYVYSLLLYLLDIINWIIMLNIGIGIANLLPMIPLDGGFMAKELLDTKNIEYSKILHYITLYSLLLAIFFPGLYRFTMELISNLL